MTWVILVLLGIAASGCVGVRESRYSHTPGPEVFRKWREGANYYALLEIVDVYIDPFNHKATKADVLKYLGPGCDTEDNYPQAGPRMWVYPSVRPVPYGSYLIIYFDEHDVVKEIGWASE